MLIWNKAIKERVLSLDKNQKIYNEEINHTISPVDSSTAGSMFGR
jgi:hypothetical protein